MIGHRLDQDQPGRLEFRKTIRLTRRSSPRKRLKRPCDGTETWPAGRSCGDSGCLGESLEGKKKVLRDRVPDTYYIQPRMQDMCAARPSPNGRPRSQNWVYRIHTSKAKEHVYRTVGDGESDQGVDGQTRWSRGNHLPMTVRH